MEPRIDYSKANPGAARAMYGLEAYVRKSGLETSLLDLVRVRASQINGCAFCAGGPGPQTIWTNLERDPWTACFIRQICVLSSYGSTE